MPFSNQTDNNSTSTLVKLKGNPLNHVMSLKAKWLKVTGKDLHKGTAIALILNQIPKDEINKAINEIVKKAKLKKK